MMKIMKQEVSGENALKLISVTTKYQKKDGGLMNHKTSILITGLGNMTFFANQNGELV